MPAFPPIPAGTARSILLVEEYDALAVAIGSALKKFAPAHRTHVVARLAAAEKSVAELDPELLVLDFDPPQAGAVDFFNRLRTTAPELRVLIIAAGVPADLLAARQDPAAFQFIAKPFDLAQFGASVQALLHSAPGASALPETGTLSNLNLADLLPLLCAAGATVVIEVEAANLSGEVHLVQGQIVHAEAEEQIGKAALAMMLRWRSPHFNEAERPAAPVRTIQQPWSTALMEGLQKSKPPRTASRTAKRASTAAPASPPKKLVVIDDTELLLLFVEDVLKTSEPAWEIITASTGTDGVERVTSTSPDVVLLDYSLPDITGDEVCRRLAANESTARIPIVLMSGHVPEMIATAAHFDNVVATIAKPFLSHALVQLVRNTLAAPRPPSAPSVSLPPALPASPPPSPESEQMQSTTPASQPPALPEQKGNGHHPPAAPPPPPIAQKPEPPACPPAASTPMAQEEAPARSEQRTSPGWVAPPPRVALAEEQTFTAPARTPIPQRTAEIAPPRFEDPVPLARNRVAEVVSPLAPVRIPTAASNAVVLGLSLEVVSMQFSSSLRMAAIRARPWSRTVSLHMHPQALPGVALPEAGFELGRVDLDTRGQMETVRLLPTGGAPLKPPLRDVFPVGDVAVLPANGDRAMQLMPAPVAPMTMQLFASFDLAGVELSANFGVGSILLKSRGADIRVTLQPGGPSTGATFKSAQVLLDRSARIAEILLDAVA